MCLGSDHYLFILWYLFFFLFILACFIEAGLCCLSLLHCFDTSCTVASRLALNSAKGNLELPILSPQSPKH